MKHLFKTNILFLLVALIFSACSNVSEWESNISTDESVVFSEALTGTFGTFTAYSVLGDQVWTENSSYAIMTGYVNSVNNANEDWLISPEIDLSELTEANVSFDHVVRYFDNPNESATVWISENYTDGDPSGADWTKLDTQPFVDYSSWDFVPSGEISLTAWVGKKVRIAFKYTSTSADAGTWELRNVVVSNKEAVVVDKNYGSGKEKDPYTADGAVYHQGSGAWVSAYIVGYIYVGSTNVYVFGADTCSQTTNMLIASSINSVYLSKTIPVQLPYGDVRNALNLKDNKDNLHKKVKLYGTLASYFSVPGLKEVSYFEFEDGTSGGTKPFDPSTAIFYESFESSLGNFTTYSVLGGEVWTHNSTYKCAYMSGYVGVQNRANEDWLISPEIDLTGETNPVVTFDHALRYNANPSSDATIWVSEDYVSGDPYGATWTQLPTSLKDGTDWTFVNVGDFSLAAYSNKKIKIALVYKATSTKAGTWEVKNFVVK